MAVWHRTRRGDLCLRAVGLALCGLSYLAITTLVAMHVPPQAAGPVAYGLAALGFLCASGGSAMAILGRRLFDEIEVSSRWRRADPDERPYPFLSERNGSMKDAEPEMLVIGRDVDGCWTVRESAGSLVARFPTEKAARSYAVQQRRHRPLSAIVSSSGFRPRIKGRLTLASNRSFAGQR